MLLAIAYLPYLVYASFLCQMVPIIYSYYAL